MIAKFNRQLLVLGVSAMLATLAITVDASPAITNYAYIKISQASFDSPFVTGTMVFTPNITGTVAPISIQQKSITASTFPFSSSPPSTNPTNFQLTTSSINRTPAAITGSGTIVITISANNASGPDEIDLPVTLSDGVMALNIPPGKLCNSQPGTQCMTGNNNVVTCQFYASTNNNLDFDCGPKLNSSTSLIASLFSR